mmetsp:Transcript_37745/g.78350  ORF Transcript_37745/g.78350 Transcript_37745/m.78350 type:complete len:231 (-) Transcript_37745:274-966(-)
MSSQFCLKAGSFLILRHFSSRFGPRLISNGLVFILPSGGLRPHQGQFIQMHRVGFLLLLQGRLQACDFGLRFTHLFVGFVLGHAQFTKFFLQRIRQGHAFRGQRLFLQLTYLRIGLFQFLTRPLQFPFCLGQLLVFIFLFFRQGFDLRLQLSNFAFQFFLLGQKLFLICSRSCWCCYGGRSGNRGWSGHHGRSLVGQSFTAGCSPLRWRRRRLPFSRRRLFLLQRSSPRT